MKKNILKLVFFVIALFLTTGFIACGFNSNDDDNEDNSVVVTWYKTPDAIPYRVSILEGSFTMSQADMNRPGYKFLGLYDAPSGGTQVVNAYGTANISISKAITLYAQWEVKEYKIIFEADEEELDQNIKEATYFYETELTTFPVPTKDGYDFIGWSNGKGTIYTDSNGLVKDKYNVLSYENYKWDENDTVYLYPEYEIKNLTVTFDYNDGSYNTESRKVKYGSTLYPSTYPKLDTGSKKIIGWSVNRTEFIEFNGVVENDITLYAIWQEYKVITLITDENEEPQKIVVNKNEEVKLPTPKKEGYDFAGWYITNYYSGLPVTNVTYGSSSDTYYAKWDAKQFKIVFEASEEELGENDREVIYFYRSDLISFPVPTKEGYNFLGWSNGEETIYTDEEGKVKYAYSILDFDYYKCDENETIHLYPEYEIKKLTVTFDFNDSSYDNESITVQYGLALNASTYPDKDTGSKKIIGWSTDSDELIEYVGIVTNDIILYAIWQEYKTIYLVTNINSRVEKLVIIENEEKNLPIPQKNGYVFDGWYSDELFTEPTVTQVNYDTEYATYYAKWNLASYTIRFETNGGDAIIEDINYTIFDSVQFPSPGKKENYEFAGWYLTEDLSGKAVDSIRAGNYGDLTVYAKWNPGIVLTATQIHTVFDLKKINENLSGTYVLMNDINCQGLTIDSIGKNKHEAFTGIFEGQGYTISNFKIDKQEYLGLFAYNAGTIQNLNVDASLSYTECPIVDVWYVGGIAGYNTGIIDKCTAQGTVSVSYAYSTVAAYGGLITGQNEGAISNCISKGTVSMVNNSSIAEKYQRAAGISGRNLGSISNCISDVTAKSYAFDENGFYADKSYGEAGGITGVNEESGVIKNCVALGSLNGNWKTGDISARNSGVISNCYNYSEMKFVNNKYDHANDVGYDTLNSEVLYQSLGWDPQIWDYTNIDFENKIYPKLIQKSL